MLAPLRSPPTLTPSEPRRDVPTTLAVLEHAPGRIISAADRIELARELHREFARQGHALRCCAPTADVAGVIRRR